MSEELKKRTKKFALDVIKLCSGTSWNFEVRSPRCESRPVRQSKFDIRHSPRLWIQLFHSALKNGEAGTSGGKGEQSGLTSAATIVNDRANIVRLYCGEEDFKEQLEILNAAARELESTIASNVTEILET